MNKLIIIATSLFVSFSSFSQILSDEIGSDGGRHIIGEFVNVRIFTDRGAIFHVGLSAMQFGDSSTTFLSIKAVNASPYKVDKDMQLLIKVADGSVITLRASNDYNATVRDIHTIGNTVMSDYSTIVSYCVTESDLVKMTTGVLKIRMEVSGGYFEKEFKKDKIGEVVRSEYPEIKKRLSQKKNFSDNF